MRNLIFLFINFLIAVSCKSQTFHIDSITDRSVNYSEGKNRYDNKSFWKKYIRILCNEIGVRQFDTSGKGYHFRLYTSNQILDLTRFNDDLFLGSITQWTREIVPSGEKPTGRIHKLDWMLHGNAIDSLYRFISTCGIDTLPTQDKINGWRQGFDGVMYILESYNEGVYNFRNYWSPTAQGSLAGALLVQRFIDNCLFIAHADSLSKEFYSTLKFQNWGSDGAFIGTRPYTYKQLKEMKKERDKYRRLNTKKKNVTN